MALQLAPEKNLNRARQSKCHKLEELQWRVYNWIFGSTQYMSDKTTLLDMLVPDGVGRFVAEMWQKSAVEGVALLVRYEVYDRRTVV